MIFALLSGTKPNAAQSDFINSENGRSAVQVGKAVIGVDKIP